jgi:hypothetical protein
MKNWNAKFMHRAMNQLGTRDDSLHAFQIIVVMTEATYQSDVGFYRMRAKSITRSGRVTDPDKQAKTKQCI